MAEVIWAPSALDDVESIAEFIARDSRHRGAISQESVAYLSAMIFTVSFG